MERAIFDGFKLKEKRLALKITAEEMAEKIQLSEARSYRRIENSGITSLSTLKNICTHINMQPNELQIELNPKFFINQLDVNSINSFLIKYTIFNQSKCFLLFSTLHNITKGKDVTKLNMKVLLNRYRKESEDAELDMITMYSDLCLMKIFGWISFKHIDPIKDEEINLIFTYRNPVCKPIHHYTFLLFEIAVSMKNNQDRIIWDVKNKSRNRLFLYQKGWCKKSCVN